MKKIISAWMVRPKPNGENIIEEFIDQGFIAVGCPYLGRLKNKSSRDIQRLIEERPAYKKKYNTTRKMAMAVSPLNRFVNDMQLGDYVILPDGEDIYLARIAGDYEYFKELDNDDYGYPHQRRVDFQVHLKRYHLDDDLRNSLRTTMSLANFTEHVDSIEGLIEERRPKGPKEKASHSSDPNDYFEISYPVESGGLVAIKIPTDIKNQELDRLIDLISSLKKNA